MINHKKISSIALAATISLFSCSEEFTTNNPLEKIASENAVSLEEAIGIASVLEFKGPHISRAKVKDQVPSYKTVSQSLSIPDANGLPNLHIVNYKEGGYAIVSGDNRIAPILAIAENGSLTLTEDNLPEGLILWLAETSDMVSYTKKMNEPRTNLMVQSWGPCETRALSTQTESPCPEDCDKNYYAQVNPLLSTTWNQGVG